MARTQTPTCSSLLPCNKRKCRSRARIESWRTAPFSLRASLTADRNSNRNSSNTNKEKHKHNPDNLGQIKARAQNTPNVQHQRPSNLVDPRAPGDPPAVEPAGYKRPVEANIDSATGQPYLIYEGTFLDTVLMNRLDGDSSGPVKVLVSNPLYSHDHQHVIIPDGTVVLGEARKIGAAGFGQQRRMAVVFHRLIMPDGYSVDLDQFHGLDQIGEEGLKDKVNNHYLQIFGTSIALGIIAGAGEITAGGGTITTSGSQAFTNGAAGGVSQSASTILDRFIQIPPTITIREGHRVKVYFSQDLLIPAYENHTIPRLTKENFQCGLRSQRWLSPYHGGLGRLRKLELKKWSEVASTARLQQSSPRLPGEMCHLGGHGVGVYDDIQTRTPPTYLTGKPATAEQRADFLAKTKARAAQCKPLDDQYLQLQRQLDKAQQEAAGAQP